MTFELNQAIQILNRTPSVIESLLMGVSEEWISANEGPDTWTAYDIVGHLIHGEKTDWIPRVEIMMSPSQDKRFPSFDRFAQFESSRGKSLPQLLEEFATLRKHNLAKLKGLNLSNSDLARTGIHPEFGEVTLRQHLSTWVVHDLDHLSQIVRVMSKQYRNEVGPWQKYLKVLRS